VVFEKLSYEQKNGIGLITLNDPENRNIISGVIVDELEQCLDACAENPDVRVIVLKGAGKAFSAGGNINRMKERIDAGRYAEYGTGIRKLSRIVVRLRNIRKPIIAAIHGAAAGGGLNLALACDFRIAADDTKFVFAFVNIGLVPDVGGPLPLVRIAGVARATELLMTGRRFTAREASDWGLINEAVPLEELEEATMKLAAKLSQGPTLSYGCIKAMINRVAFSGLELELDNEAEYQVLCAGSEDHKEGVNAFLEKRIPVFKGR
jgi:2-(1,2-epoxy-1,2-dihydrophenyl)acetyl-CoA isomerase